MPVANITFGDYPLKDVRNFAARGGHSLLWPEATTFLSHREAHSRREIATVACSRGPLGKCHMIIKYSLIYVLLVLHI